MIRTILKPLSFIPALLLMYMIFSFSGQTGDVSSQLSYKVSYKMIEAADYVFDANLDEWQKDEWANKINFITRKLAHMTEYFALAVAVSFPLYVYGMHGFLLMLVAGMICVGFACGDEYHQSFVVGRSPSAKDVCIDSVGVFFGIILVRIIGWTGRKTIFKPRKPKKQKIKKVRGRQNDLPYYDDYYPEQPPYRDNRYPRRPFYREDYVPEQPPYHENYVPEQPPYREDYYPEQPPYREDYVPEQPPYREDYYPEQPPYREDYVPEQPPYREDYVPEQPPYREQKQHIKNDKGNFQTKKKNVKKEKDWFFDM